MDDTRLAKARELAEWTKEYHGMQRDEEVAAMILELIDEILRLNEQADT